MPIPFTCPSCQSAFRVADGHAGKRGRCPRCQTRLDIPRPEPDDDVAASDPRRLMKRILDAFEGDIEPVRVTFAYRLGMLLVACAMLLLPVLYVALIAGVGFLLFYHVTHGLAVVTSYRSVYGVIFLYAAPLIAGVILLFFMVKPLFARPARGFTLKTLEFGEEPLLFALVTRVARAVGAPEPRRIELDCQVNASAGFRSFFGRDLVLTIGLPLVAGLNTRHLAGIVAHELGHFAQGGGMRLNYLVRSINMWFARVVYERDEWDETLVAWSEESERLSLIFLLARFCVWVTRGILWVFMAAGHAISCFLSRQQEYDADRYEVRLVGSDTFADSSGRLGLLGVTANHVFGTVAHIWHQKGRLPEDLSDLISATADRVPENVLVELRREIRGQKTGLFDTHPAPADRIASARREKTPGVFHLDVPATRLFSDFPRLSRAVSFQFFRCVFGKRVKRSDLLPASAYLDEDSA